MEQSYTQSTASVNGAKINTILNVFKKDFKQALLDAKTAGKEIGFGIYASPDKQLKLFNRQKGSPLLLWLAYNACTAAYTRV